MEILDSGTERHGAEWEIYQRNEDQLELHIINPLTGKKLIRDYYILHPLSDFRNRHKIGIIIDIAASDVMRVYH